MLLGASATSVTFAGSALAAVAGLGVYCLADGRGLGRCRRFRLRRRKLKDLPCAPVAPRRFDWKIKM
jgi:hypothetical protein